VDPASRVISAASRMPATPCTTVERKGMLKERTYSTTNKCLTRIKSSNLDQMLKVRLECQFIRLKRHILSSPVTIMMEDILALEEISEEIIDSEHKDLAIGKLEQKIRQIINASDSSY
jgi:CRISPR/Cas system-associated protein Csx1